MDKAAAIAPPLDEPPPTVLAALGPQMTALAAQRTNGAFPYNVTPEHTARARAIIGPDKWLCVDDHERSRPAVRSDDATQIGLPIGDIGRAI
jgi:alkanesulfonate monooxygenase SsuD/methylene tetrahydromethanopterin reductase-like flavin-dependent oxidoreductase (luciferase family)